MDLKTVLDEVGAWPAEQRLRLVEEVWGGLCAASDVAEVDSELRSLLDHRIESLDQNPEAVIAWEAVEAQSVSAVSTMSLPVVLTLQAAAEFDAASDWYQEQAALGAEFTAHIRDALRRLGGMPQVHPAIYRDICRVTLKQFPYNIYFRRRPDRVEVIAILHGRRDPSVWKKR